jgi:hypothetical protein
MEQSAIAETLQFYFQDLRKLNGSCITGDKDEVLAQQLNSCLFTQLDDGRYTVAEPAASVELARAKGLAEQLLQQAGIAEVNLGSQTS